MYRLTIENFQSIRGPLTVTVDGLTCIIGESNIGKSAIIRALLALLNNARGSEFITTGQNYCRIMLECGGHTVVWTRTVKSAEYEIDGKRFAKLDGSVPQELKDLGFDSLLVGKVPYWPQIHEQDDSPFALREGPTVVASLLGVNEEVRTVNRAVKSLQKSIQEFNREEEFLSGKLHRQNEVVEGLARFRDGLQVQLQQVDSLEQLKGQASARGEMLAAVKEQYGHTAPRATVGIDLVADTPDVSKHLAMASTAIQYRRIGHQSSTVLDDVSAPAISSRAVQLSTMKARYQSLPKSFLHIQSPADPPQYDYLAKQLADLRVAYYRAGDTQQTLAVDLERADGAFNAVEKELRQIKQSFPLCPFCGSAVGSEVCQHA